MSNPVRMRRVRTGDKDLELMQNNVQSAFNGATRRNVLADVKLLASANPNYVSHGLGATLGGWVVIRKRGQADVWDTQDENLMPDRTLLLKCSADVVVDLEVFSS